MAKRVRDGGASAYDADSLTVLTGLDNIRQSPAEYVGSVAAVSATNGRGREQPDEVLTAGGFHLFVEVLANATDEANNFDEAGRPFADRIDVTLGRDQSITVADNGRGLPVGINAATGLPAAVAIFLIQNSGAKFLDPRDKGRKRPYKAAAGLHGMGNKCVSALSDRVDVTVFRDGRRYDMHIKGGTPGAFDGDAVRAPFTACEMSEALTESADDRPEAEREAFPHGTVIRWHPDPTIWGGTDLPLRDIYEQVESQSYMTPACTFTVRDETGDEPRVTVYHHPGGIVDMIGEKTARASNVTPVISFDVPSSYVRPITTENPDGTMSREEVRFACDVRAAIRWTGGSGVDVEGYANGVRCVGKHVDGFRRGVTRGVNDWLGSPDGGASLLTKKDEKAGVSPNIDDITCGMVAVVEVIMEDQCDFQGQTKDVLCNPEVLSCVSDAVKEQVAAWLSARRNAKAAKAVGRSILDNARLRMRQKAERENARKVRDALSFTSKPAKLVDCRAEGPDSGSELLIAEGESAAGTIKLARNATYQSLLPVKGVTLSVYKQPKSRVLANGEFAALVNAMHAGIRDEFDMSKRRYERIGIYTDSDEAGSYIRCLLLLFIYYELPGMIEAGKVFAGVPPLYSIHHVRGEGKGRIDYVADEAERTRYLDEFLRGGGSLSNLSIQRAKGLGELDVEVFKTFLLPETRRVRVITLEDVEEARRRAEDSLWLMFADTTEAKARRREWIDDTFVREDD